jgi:hypothetical protein
MTCLSMNETSQPARTGQSGEGLSPSTPDQQGTRLGRRLMEFARCEPGSEPDLIQFAQRLLEVSDPVDCVAEPTGFSTAMNLRKHFGQIVYNSPHDAAVRSRTGGSVALS